MNLLITKFLLYNCEKFHNWAIQFFEEFLKLQLIILTMKQSISKLDKIILNRQ